MPALRFRDILGQDEAIDFLQRVAAGGRYGNAYLLHGPGGVGKGSAAIAFARAMMCERGAGGALDVQPSLFGAPEPAPAVAPAATTPGDACDECAACHKSRDLQHPDLKFLFPLTGEEKELDTVYRETVDAWREDPFFTFVYEKAASIRLSTTRELLRELAFRPFEARHRVVVVRDADRMREDQYSAMLKSIEEPGASTVWVLTTSRPTRLPATIRSRCQRVRFRALHEDVIDAYLRERVGVADDASRLLAALSSGSLGRALQGRDTDPRLAAGEIFDLLGRARAGDPAALWGQVQRMMNFGRTGRDKLRRYLEYLILWQRDLLRWRYEGEAAQLVHVGRRADIARAAAAVDPTEIRRRLMLLEECLRSIDGNVAADASIFSALSRLANPALSRTGWPRHPAARWVY